jgi:hypothetical protein
MYRLSYTSGLEDQQKKLFEENRGDIIIKGQNGKTWNVISHIIKIASPAFDLKISQNKEKKSFFKRNKTKIYDMKNHNNDNIDIMLRYIYYKYMVTDISKFNPSLLCQLVSLLDEYELHEPKNHIIYLMCEIKTKDLIFSLLNEFSKYNNMFQTVRNTYCDHVIAILKNNIKYACFDKTSDYDYGLCCMHTYKIADNKYSTYEIDNKYYCICTNLKKRSFEDKKMNYFNEDDIIDDEYYITDNCCQHRYKNFIPMIDDSYSYDELLKLHDETRQYILKKMMT